MRIVKEKSFKYGLNDVDIEAKDESTLDRLVEKIIAKGWEREWTSHVQDCDYGFAATFAVRSDVFEDFNQSFKEAKVELIAELKKEKQSQCMSR